MPQEPATTTPPPRDLRLLDAMRASEDAGFAPGYNPATIMPRGQPQDEESLGVQYLLAVPRGVEGMLKGAYGFADFVAFDSLPDWKKRLLGQSTHWGPGLVEGLATYVIPGSVAVKAFGAAQKGAGWAARLSRLGRGAMAGAVTDAVITDPDGGRLSDWIKSQGGDWALTNYLASDPEDSEATSRFKNALEGIVPGVALDAVGEVFRAIRGVRNGQATTLDPKPVRSAMAAMWRDEFGFDHDQHAAVESFIEAAGLDRTKIRPASELPADLRPADLDLTARAYTLFQEDGTAFIGALRNPDLTSALHELAHVARRQLFDPERGVAPKIEVAPEDLATAKKWAGANEGWTTAAEEKFAGGFEKYLRDGVAPSKGLERFFEKVATYFRRVYNDLTGTALDVDVTPEMAEVFGRVLSRGERMALTNTKVQALSRVRAGVVGLVKGPQTRAGKVDLVLYSKDGGLRAIDPETEAVAESLTVSRGTPFPGTLEDAVEKATADAAFLYRASLEPSQVLIVKPGTVPDAATLERGGYLAWAEEGGQVNAVKRIPVERMGQSSSKAGEVLNVRGPGLTRALAQDADVLYQGARREGDAPQFGNARFDPGQPFEPINLDRIASPSGARQALMDALAKAEVRQRATESLETAHARAVETVREFADANGEAVPQELVKILLNKSADQIRQHADRLGAARELLAGLGVQLHQKIKAATKGGVNAASDDDLVEILRAQQNIAAVTEGVREVQTEVARALGAQRIRYRGTTLTGKEWIPPRPEQGGVVPTPDQAKPTLETSTAPDVAPGPAVVQIPDPKISPRATATAILEAHGGRKKVEKMVNQLDAFMDMHPGGIPPATVRKGWFSMVPEYYINSILSGPITHATNLLSGAINTVVVPLERALGNLALGRGSAAGRELADLSWHIRESRDAINAAWLALKRDQSVLMGGSAGVLEGGQIRAISATAQGVEAESLAGKSLTGIGKVVNLPARLLLAEDELLKQLNYRARFGRRLEEIARERFTDPQARVEWVEQMMRASGEQGQAYSLEALQRRGAELAARANVDPANRAEYIAAYVRKNWDEKAHLASLDGQQRAREATFTEEFGTERGALGFGKNSPLGFSVRDSIGKASGAFANLTQQVPALRLFFPFIRTPTNILQWFLDRSVGVVSDGAALLASKQVRAAYTPEAKAALIGRFATGSALMTMAAIYASQRDENGLPLLTGAGPTDPDERRAWEATGWRPYSIRVGDRYVSYKRVDPSATFFGIVADMVQERAYSEALNRQPEMGKAMMIALTNNLVSKTYMLGALNLARAIGEPERFGMTMAEGFMGAMAPFSSTVHQAVNPLKGDEVLHEIRGLSEAFKSKWVLADPSKRPVRRNVLGEPILRDRGVGGDPWSPLRYVEVKDDPVAEELVRVGAGFQPPRETSNGVDWTTYRNEQNQTAYDRWMELHGQVQIGGKTMRDSLAATIQSRGYQRLPLTGVDDLDSPRVAALRRVVSRYREVARRQAMIEFPDLSSDARKLVVAARMLRAGQQVETTGVQ